MKKCKMLPDFGQNMRVSECGLSSFIVQLNQILHPLLRNEKHVHIGNSSQHLQF